jgi:hypothetical protein
MSRLDKADYDEVAAAHAEAVTRANDLENGTSTRPLLVKALEARGLRYHEQYGPPAWRVAYLADLEDHPED